MAAAGGERGGIHQAWKEKSREGIILRKRRKKAALTLEEKLTA